MNRVIVGAAIAVCSVVGLLTAEFAAAADAPGGRAIRTCRSDDRWW